MAGLRLGDVTAAAITALNADTSITTALGGSKSYANVPEETQPPYVFLVGGAEVPWVESFSASGDDGGRQVDVIAEVWSKAFGTKEVDAISNLVLTRLTTESTWRPSVTGYAGMHFVGTSPIQKYQVDGTMWVMRTTTVQLYLSHA